MFCVLFIFILHKADLYQDPALHLFVYSRNVFIKKIEGKIKIKFVPFDRKLENI